MSIEAYHYSHHINIGCKQYIVSYKPAGPNWTLSKGEGTPLGLSFILGGQEADDRPPEFVLHEVKKGRLNGAHLKRIELEQIVEAFQNMLDYDQEVRDEIEDA